MPLNKAFSAGGLENRRESCCGLKCGNVLNEAPHGRGETASYVHIRTGKIPQLRLVKSPILCGPPPV